MKPTVLFLERYRQLSVAAEATTEISLLDLGAILRQLLADKHSLVDTANTGRLPLAFVVGEYDPFWRSIPGIPEPTLYSLEDGIDPEDIPNPVRVILTKDGFLAHQIAMSHGNAITIKDLIKYAANVAGGVHHDPSPKVEYQAVHAASEVFMIGGLPFGIRPLRAIARVTLRALKPLADSITTGA